MKAIIIGGCADMAVPLLNLLRDDNDFKKVILADLNEKKAKELSAKYKGEGGYFYEKVY